MTQDLETRLTALENRIAELESIEAVRATILEYAHVHDRGMSDSVADLFTEDTVLDITGYGEQFDTSLSGQDAVRAMYNRLDARHNFNPPFKHMLTNCLITIEGDEAVAITYLDEWGGPQTKRGPGGGLYHDRLRKEADGQWRFAHKKIISISEQTVDEAIRDGI
jgi:ketosteroid isomerase-like protein